MVRRYLIEDISRWLQIKSTLPEYMFQEGSVDLKAFVGQYAYTFGRDVGKPQ